MGVETVGPAPLSGCQSLPIRVAHPRQPWKLQGYVVTPVCSPPLSRQLSFRVHLASLFPLFIPAHQTDTPWGVGGRRGGLVVTETNAQGDTKGWLPSHRLWNTSEKALREGDIAKHGKAIRTWMGKVRRVKVQVRWKKGHPKQP